MSEGITKEEIIEQFKGNKVLKTATYIVGGIVVLILGFLAYTKFIKEPKNEESQIEIADGIMFLEKDSTQLAIDEFEYLAEEYKGYKGGQISNYALGNLYFEEGDYEAAIDAMKKVKVDDSYIMTLALGTQADAYSELEEYEKAVQLYVKAARRIDNDVTSPTFYFKAGLNAEEIGDFEKAAQYYQTIKDKYPTFANQQGMEKYITQAENSIVK